ncbi:hypothetical protein ACIOD2_32475 [Amycolatopsis sp. NPDC088138]|uniref:hypothetical protein n=1 Tax=Amycolatopsis sp. NPDC088138 TaxID=3363938 RepID=UPI003823AB60
MTPDEARTQLRKIARERDQLTEAEPKAILDALAAGVKQGDIATDIGRTREHVRRVARAHGIEP